MRVTGAKKNPKLTEVNTPSDGAITGPKAKIHNVFIVDASGSMGGSKYENAILGINELLQNIVQDTDSDNTAMIVEFEGNRVVRRLDLTENVPSKYKGMGTGGMTPLNQAIGETLEYLALTRKNKYDVADKVLVNIFTDGLENSSSGQYANPSVLSAFIKKLEDDGFTITFIGTKNEVHYAIETLSMDASNTLVHTNTAASIKKSFDTTVLARGMYSKSVAKGEDVKANFYTKTVSK